MGFTLLLLIIATVAEHMKCSASELPVGRVNIIKSVLFSWLYEILRDIYVCSLKPAIHCPYRWDFTDR